MKPFVLERKQFLPIDLATAWSFFSDPSNLLQITPPDMKLRITSPHNCDIHAGQIITYTLNPLMGMRSNWTTEITHLDRPFFFVDEQRFGPYRFWHHQHHFKEVAGGVEIVDLIHYLLYHEQLAKVINALIVAPRLKRIFSYREAALLKLFPVSNTFKGDIE